MSAQPAAVADASVRGLVLTGGGARAAYQVGVLKAISAMLLEAGQVSAAPFPVITGTSAGGINAAALAAGADDFHAAVRSLVEVWSGFHADQVYRTDSIGVLRSGARWLTMVSIGWVIARWRRLKPRSLLDNAPLAERLAQWIRLERIPQHLADGHLQAISVAASSYSSGKHVSFYAARGAVPPWSAPSATRRRVGWRMRTFWPLPPSPSCSLRRPCRSTVNCSGSAMVPCGKLHPFRRRCTWEQRACS